MTTVGICFSNIHDNNLPELTKTRTIASVPFGARYRMIDFTLSSMVNAGIENIGIITRTKYRSLMEHIGTGKDWDLNRNNGGVTFLTPFFEAGSGPLYSNRLEALQNSFKYIQMINADYVLMADCDLVANFPFDEIIKYHEKSGADITGAYKKAQFNHRVARYSEIFNIDKDNTIQSVSVVEELLGSLNFGMNIWVMKKSLLQDIIKDSRIYGYKSFSRELLPMLLEKLNVKAYEYKGYLGGIDSLYDYYETNMDLLDNNIRHEIFGQDNSPIYTRVMDSAPTRYGANAKVTNSVISDGCVINGTVENSIIFRDVRIDEGAVVKNSIIFSKSIIEMNADLDYIVTDKQVVISKGRRLYGCTGHPFFIGFGEIV